MSQDVHFKIIVPMYNCAKWAIGCLDSVFNQTYQNWQLVVCVDPSTDNTFFAVDRYLQKHMDKNWLLIKNVKRKYVPKNHVDSIIVSKPNNDDVIICLDGDDRLYDNDVLSYLASVYQDENVWVTWGSFLQTNNGKRGGASQPIPEPEKDEHRGERWWRYSHLKTFRYFLFKGIKDEDLRSKATGNYYTAAGDMALMFPMVEMAGLGHGRFLDKILYLYNNSTPFNDEKINKVLVKQCDAEIRSRQKYTEKTREELCQIVL